MNTSVLRTTALLTALLASAAAVAAEPAVAAKAPDARCHAGAYRLDDDSVVSVGTIDKPEQLRWRLIDGRTGKLTPKDGAWVSTRGWSDRPDGVQVSFGACDEGRIQYEGHAGKKIKFDIVDTKFEGKGVSLRGRLVLPQGSGPVPVIVMVHGSENYSGVDSYYQQHLFPAEGVGVFVYDKRGTGGSSGKYSQNFHDLSDDASAALREAQRLGGPRIGRIGFHGGSQGGWVAPLAASKTPQAQFVFVGFGLADSVLAEDRDQVVLDLRAAGFGDAQTLRKAREVSDVTGLIASTNGKRGWEALDALREKYQGEPWWKSLKGEYSGLIALHTREESMAEMAKYDYEVSWDYDPMPVLKTLNTPQLWVLGGDDVEAPPQETQKRLIVLGQAGRPITSVVFPQADHGILEFEKDAKGERQHTRTADGYVRMQLDWVKDGTLKHWPYGTAKRLAGPK
ncbi:MULTISPECIES: alpha/beta hydrolase family protein [Lysobacter]|uniref:alpha/beta hydrolase family protein n=1 Tax=Lysobacter TaxID=68 RepID=UPI001F2C7FCA|nr:MULTISPECIES: alpha/beta hydrolase [Lysobacter]UJB18994.1 alpha/beta hydrolase [Lysobacter capsici]UJQ27281.1 alpha/beta hydrolase [Lysobacter gummosus]